MSDTEMVRRYLDGDIRYLGELYAKHRRRTFACACAILRDPDKARDCDSDAWLAIREALPGFDRKRSFLKWALGIVRHKALDVCRGLVRESRVLVPLETIEPDLGPAGPSLEQERRQNVLSEELVRALDRLPSVQSEEILLHEVQGLSYREIGRRTGRCPGTVGSDIHRGLARLRAELAPLLAHQKPGKETA